MINYQQIFIYFIPPKYPAPPFNPPAWNYDNLIGMIWLEGNPASYDNSHTGQIELREPSGEDAQLQAQGGSYDTSHTGQIEVYDPSNEGNGGIYDNRA